MATVTLEQNQRHQSEDSQEYAPRVKKAECAKLKATYRQEHPAEPPELPDRDKVNWWEWDAVQEESARLTQEIAAQKAVAERVRVKFQKQLALRKVDRARTKEIRRLGARTKE